MGREQFKTVEVGIEVGEVNGIAVAQAGAVHQRTVMVDGAGTVDDFVVAVAVDIAYREIMVALSVSAFARYGRVVYPTLGEAGTVES